MSTGIQYTIHLHADETNNIVFDGFDVKTFSYTVLAAPVTVVKIKDHSGTFRLDAYDVQTSYPAGTEPTFAPSTTTVTQLIQDAFAAVQAAIVDGVHGGGGTGKVILTLGVIVPGSGYANGVHTSVKLNGGNGYGASADITVAGGVVTVVALRDAGMDYLVADSLTANLGNHTTTFSIPVATIGVPLTNTTY